MAAFRIHLMGQNQPLDIDLPCRDLTELMTDASRAKFLIGHLTAADEEGVCRGVMIATCRIQCVVEVS
ncbi:MAG: hypothetical protein B7X90_11185 [Novosphingobium sp. 17-62-19]|uniref:hypothetical protein n=1 Tax=Novosphingobium sp. 17-62-19 TaxID=1970406 RepID=UPI000BCAF779|nr:hypothetical protein [Novosphingobium sp. 17-62-19]OZA18732.1 MAG: hypothetical protein B7X90_11185 [Novosphingobium sp. 17-62-19]HQS97324.1 hypothetical protein [Novosphingobium sp.]